MDRLKQSVKNVNIMEGGGERVVSKCSDANIQLWQIYSRIN